ncbi:unnamed protein product [Rangifer tarandus platyrhynchus]|uniref:Uncharacterized protein n=1 Tax=Rangifer tarandus platyrhynchus TaxID=3082113 RepID=A0AC59Z8N0_RANTA
MFPGLSTLFLILSGMEFLIGILGNMFIGLVLCSECVKNQKTSLFYFILTGLAISRISQLLVYFLQSLIMGLHPQVFAIFKLAKPISLLWRISNHLTTWLVTCLSIFYLLKIAHFSHSLFFWLKWRMKRVILVMLAFSLVFLILDILLLETFNMFNSVWISGYKIYAKNSTWFSDLSETHYLPHLIVFNFINLIPFLLSLTSLLLLSLSLMRHIRNLQLNPSSKDLSTEAHKRAMKMVMSFLFFFVIHVSSILLTGWVFLKQRGCLAKLVVVLTSTVFPSSHSFILILGNSKLRQNVVGLLWYLNCHPKRVKSLAS